MSEYQENSEFNSVSDADLALSLMESDRFQFKDPVKASQSLSQIGITLPEIMSQLLSISYLTAAVTDITKAVEDGSLSRSKYRDLELYLPAGITLLPGSIAKVLRHCGEHTITGDLATLPSRLKFALRMSRIVIASPDDKRVDAAAFASAWTFVASGLVEALALCDHLQTSSGRNNINVKGAEKLLAEVLNGERPCINRFNNISIPDWAERRDEKRHKCEIPVKVHSVHGQQDAILTDLSRTGLGLSGCESLEPGDQIGINKQTGSVLSGRVVRHKDGRTGVKLKWVLGADDPWLRLAMEKNDEESEFRFPRF